MIVRIVQMTFIPEKVKEFTDLFYERRETISNFPGCTHLELWQDSDNENIFFTYSIWNSEADLNHYRFSDFFKDTWSRTKVLFADKPQARSLIPR